MITNYHDFVKESKAILTDEQIKMLNHFVEGTWKINSENKIDVNGNVFISNAEIKKIPFNFGNVTGEFYCHAPNILTLSGFPQKAKFFDLNTCKKLISLEGITLYVEEECFWSGCNSLQPCWKDFLHLVLDNNYNPEWSFKNSKRNMKFINFVCNQLKLRARTLDKEKYDILYNLLPSNKQAEVKNARAINKFGL